MQKSQLEVDPWPAPLIMRARSGNGRDNKKVTCETLSKVDWYSRRPHEAQLYYPSDDDEEENPASEAEDDHEDAEGEDDQKEERRYAEKLASHVYGENVSAQGLHFLERFYSKASQGRSAMAISSPGRDAKKTEKVLRTYPSPIPHSGSLLPPSGRLLPHSGPIKLHVGSHANTHTNKVSGSLRGSSLIPSNIAGKSSKSSGFGNEPSSPKVTCLGRVKIKQKYCREMGRLADMAAGAPSSDKVHRSIADQMMKFTRRKNRPHAVAEEAEERQKPLSGVGVCSVNKLSSSSSAGMMVDLQKSQHGRWGSHGEDILRTDAASDSESKGKKGKWRLKEPGARMKLRGADKKKWQPLDASGTRHISSNSQVDCAIDLNRFRSLQRPQMEDNKVSKSLTSLSIGDESLKIEQDMGSSEFVPQVPPPNSLLLMRNSKSRGACVTVAASSCRRHGTDTYAEQVALVDRQVPLPASKEENIMQLPSSLSGVDVNARDCATMTNGYEQAVSFAEMEAKELCAVAPAECMLLQVRTNVIAHCQVSLPKTLPESTRRRLFLWQRRSIMKPSTLDVGNPLTLQVKQHTTR